MLASCWQLAIIQQFFLCNDYPIVGFDRTTIIRTNPTSKLMAWIWLAFHRGDLIQSTALRRRPESPAGDRARLLISTTPWQHIHLSQSQHTPCNDGETSRGGVRPARRRHCGGRRDGGAVLLHRARGLEARAQAVPPALACPRVRLLPAWQPPRQRRAPGTEAALLVRARSHGLRGAAHGAPGRPPRVPAFRALRRGRRDPAAAHHADALLPPPLGLVGAAPGVQRRHERRDRRHRHRHLPQGPRRLRRRPVDAAAAQQLPRRLRLDADVQRSAYCNKKLVGAKFFHEGYQAAYGNRLDETEDPRSPLDSNGHGTHTASTAAGLAVAGAAFYNYAEGKAVGMALGAHIAAYKVCWTNGCADSDILKAIDAAIDDGVDVISLSLGAVGEAPNFYEDQMAIGAFSAVRRGIVVSASAGNSGPGEYTAKNIAPWFITVGASTINRWFPASVVLDNGKTFSGASLYAGTPLGEAKIPLVYGGDVGSAFCEAEKLNTSLVAGKIVVCDPGVNARAAKGEAVKLAGGAGAILASTENFGQQALATAHILPATAVTFAAAEKIKQYIRSNASPVATIVFQGTVVGRKPSSPRMASFSSRGPNLRAPEILKPDITAPGVDILAAWTGENSPSELDSDTRRVKYYIISGTSMSCPHVSGISALLRQAHPNWSPAAIKSALMTTAYNVDNAGDIIRDMSTGQASTPFVRGAGHVDPNRAVDPDLVYDAGADDYLSFLCALGYTAEQIAKFTTKDDPAVNCSTRMASAGDLNYPAFSVVLNSTDSEVTQRRAVRNVGSNVRAKYRVTFASPAGVRVTVKPRILRFNRWRRTQEYAVTFTPLREANVTEKYTFGSIVWRDSTHKVTSPIAITWPVSQVATM
ncbi:hypothetical protein PVAP13_1NG524600 [Panicum virgatum]|uniref:Subtilisin-like protease n=1 Tax=Panicum virgatum TaxID=38727 RepID=A0A8T0X9B5_PANVG|nr:hypothetical protein PVAP13_1NG524600 [Panicum virgatum]